MTISDEDLARLQREATARAAHNWDPEEALDDGGAPAPVGTALSGALQSALDDFTGRRVTAYRPENYRDYLRTPHWIAMRDRMLKRVGGTCQRCGVRKGLEVHHLDYRHLGAERERDLLVLCHACHELEHGRTF